MRPSCGFRCDSSCVFLFFRLALEKDPEYLQAMVILGQALYQKEQFAEAAKYLERAASNV